MIFFISFLLEPWYNKLKLFLYNGIYSIIIFPCFREGEFSMKHLSQEKMVETIKNLRKVKGLTQEQLSISTGINRQMIGRLEKSEYMPSIPQLEKLAEILGFNIPDLFVENNPTVYTAYRKSNMSKEEKAGVDHIFEMMMVSKQQLLLRKAMLHE